MRKLLLSLVAFGTVVASAASQPASAQPLPVEWAPGVQSVQYYEPGWREREEWRRREEWRHHEEWRRREAWRAAHEYRRYPPPVVYAYPRY